jgi:hypothetical protein
MLSAAAQRIIGLSNSPFLDYAIVRSTAGVDAGTMEAIAAVLDEYESTGEELLSDYESSYKRRLSRGVDLTEPIYIERRGADVAPLMKFDTEKETRRAVPIYRTNWPQSTFTLAADATEDLSLSLTCRLPRIESERTGEVKVSVNGETIGTIHVTNQWTRHQLTIHQDRLRDGFNRVMLHWPPLSDEDNAAIDRAETRFRVGHTPDIFPVFGEVFSCVVKPTTGR